jgi:hypothetical protein
MCVHRDGWITFNSRFLRPANCSLPFAPIKNLDVEFVGQHSKTATEPRLFVSLARNFFARREDFHLM